MSLIITQPTGLGYYQVDNRAAGFGHFEADTYTCTHCQVVVVMNPERKRERYKCRGCDHHICDPCAVARTAGAPCRTFRQFADEIMERAGRATGCAIREIPPTIAALNSPKQE